MKPTPLPPLWEYIREGLLFTEDYELEADEVDLDILEQLGYNED